LSRDSASPAPTSRRLDQWLWFARFVKSRSRASHLCAASAVAVNGLAVKKGNHAVRVGDAIELPQGPFRRTVRVLALGTRRGPTAEARLLYEEPAAPVRLSKLAAPWAPLLVSDEDAQNDLRQASTTGWRCN
jgi:ribosome-associated heat shock protein Hsp15